MVNLLLGTGVTGVLALALGAQSWAVHRGILPRSASRKVGHVGLGSFLLLTWLLYVPGSADRWAAALPPLLLAGAFVVMGLSPGRHRRIVQAVARADDPRELLLGPLLYTATFAAFTLIFWRESPVGITALACLVLGDGMAEVAGTGIRSRPLPWNRGKSVAGTAGALAAGWFGALFLLGVFFAAGHLDSGPVELVGPALAVAAVGALLESLPWGPWDNVVVAWGCAVAGMWLL